MEYFGTDLESAGHYRWDIDLGFRRMNNSFRELPFDPENLTNNLPNGSVIFYQGGGLTVLGIAGSCKDHRPGSKSIFWVKGHIEYRTMVEKVMLNEVAQKIILQMPFKVKW